MSSPSAFKASTATRMSLPSYVLASVLALPLALIAGCPGGSIGPDPYVGEFTPVNVPGCTGKCAVRTDCPAELGGNMKLRGTVNIPAGNLPVYNARVYIPLDVMPGKPASGASCDRCSNTFVASTFTSTNPDGSFELTDVPAGENIPLVISVGKWQRIITLPKVEPCGSLKLDPETTRLPRNQSEGNIPKIALTTGGADAMECLLRKSKLGIDDSEFTLPDGNGRVNLYSGGGYTNTMGVQQPATSKFAAGHAGQLGQVRRGRDVLRRRERRQHQEHDGQDRAQELPRQGRPRLRFALALRVAASWRQSAEHRGHLRPQLDRPRSWRSHDR